MIVSSALPVVLAAMTCSFLALCDTMRMNLTPAPTVVLPEAVVPSKKSAATLTELIKSIYFCDSGNLLFKTLTADLPEYVRELFGRDVGV